MCVCRVRVTEGVRESRREERGRGQERRWEREGRESEGASKRE